ncbi:testis-specific serine/threonine-protein kinase 1-like [Schistocerca cancellata]|uniref:testis-specific serine/threonine-protein kinase 1-like n=1 Tax=Schistocerca cancellata TaxID=274614 RepID=UPI002117A81F|nr:testis-specific serine/threonine-protein kinase 1-like [Schistocerca cancellata]
MDKMAQSAGLGQSPSEMAVLAERGYQLGKKLGEGSYAKVYVAEYRRTGSADTPQVVEKLACKIINTADAPKDFVRKFLPRELDIIARLHHPHIVHMHSIWQRRAKYFIFMRFAERGDLLDFVLKNGAVSEEQSRIWLRQMALALQYLHEMDVAHRDLKCENVLISSNYNCKLADFGFARRIVDTEGKPILSTTYCGSLAYAPPEILKGTPYHPKVADIWSLGVILFVMLNKAMPFDDTNVKRLQEQQMARRWKFRSKVVNILSDQVKRLTTSMLEPETSRRVNIQQVLNADFFAMEPRLMQLTPDEKNALLEARASRRRKPGGSMEIAAAVAAKEAPVGSSPNFAKHSTMAPNLRAPEHSESSSVSRSVK